jgi:hypothetical protein
MSLGRGYECRPNWNPNLDKADANGNVHRVHDFSDLMVSSNATNMERFWWTINGHCIHAVARPWACR